MKILFEMGHPADVHFFKNSISELRSSGHQVEIAAVTKEILQELLRLSGLSFYAVGGNTPTLAGKASTILAKDLRLVWKAHSWRPDLIVSFASPYAAHASAILGVPHIAFTDTELATWTMKIVLPFTNVVCTPSCFGVELGPKQFRFNGYKELAYLHPSRFRPNGEVLERIGASPSDTLIVVRFGSIVSSHDFRHHGLELRTAGERVAFVRALEEHGRVLLTAESAIDQELQTRAMRLPVTAIHDLLYYATLYIGDGVTMANESGVLGTPWIYVSDLANGVNDDQQRTYGLGFREDNSKAALARATALLSEPNLKSIWQAKKQRMLEDKIDVTRFMVDLIENWPGSLEGVRQELLRSQSGRPGS